jgi:hypothetical protein
MEHFEKRTRTPTGETIREVLRFFDKSGPVYHTFHRLIRDVEASGIPYAIVGGMALVAHGYVRTTNDVDVLVRAEDTEPLHEYLVGCGYSPPPSGDRHFRDPESGVRIDLMEGSGPGLDPTLLPDPTGCRARIDGVWYLRLDALLEGKLSFGMSHPLQLRHLADVQELMKRVPLPRDFAERLHPAVRSKFLEFWDGLQTMSAEEREPYTVIPSS